MAEFGWAYIRCSGSGGGGGGGGGGGAVSGAVGPTGSIQFHHNSNNLSGSDCLTFDHSTCTLNLTGTLNVTEAINVNELNVNTTNKTVVNIEKSGSTKFGDTSDDIHQFTGSVFISGNLQANGNTTFGSGASDVHQFSGSVNISGGLNLNGGLVLGGGVSFNYYRLTTTPYTVQNSDYIIGVSGSGAFVINLPSASTVEAGRVIYIKDEEDFGATGRPPGVSIDITPAGTNLIDGESIYEIENGDFAAISLYSDGISNWFII